MKQRMKLCYTCSELMSRGWDVKEVGDRSEKGKCDFCNKPRLACSLYEISPKTEQGAPESTQDRHLLRKA